MTTMSSRNFVRINTTQVFKGVGLVYKTLKVIFCIGFCSHKAVHLDILSYNM